MSQNCFGPGQAYTVSLSSVLSSSACMTTITWKLMTNLVAGYHEGPTAAKIRRARDHCTRLTFRRIFEMWWHLAVFSRCARRSRMAYAEAVFLAAPKAKAPPPPPPSPTVLTPPPRPPGPKAAPAGVVPYHIGSNLCSSV